MVKKQMLCILFLLSLFLGATISIHAEKLEYKPDHIEESPIIVHSDFERIIVDKNGVNSEYKSIQKAIDDAKSGTTIYVTKGVYTEIVHIYKSIHLIGENKKNTILKPKSQKNGYALKISAPEVTIRELSVCNTGPGLYATGVKIVSPLTRIENCEIYDTPVGIAVWSLKNTIMNSTFHGCDDEGIVFLGTCTTDCTNNRVTNCIFYHNCDGIELQHSSNNSITFCEFYDNTHAGIDLIGEGNNNNIISNCNIFNNNAFGIYLSHSYGNRIEHCTIFDNTLMTTNAQGNIFIECNLDTIYLTDDSMVTFKNCKNLIESNIKATHSLYEIIEDNSDSIMYNQESTFKSRIMEKIITIVSTIRYRLKSFITTF
jgi:parallel beta-helix repeat protein